MRSFVKGSIFREDRYFYEKCRSSKRRFPSISFSFTFILYERITLKLFSNNLTILRFLTFVTKYQHQINKLHSLAPSSHIHYLIFTPDIPLFSRSSRQKDPRQEKEEKNNKRKL